MNELNEIEYGHAFGLLNQWMRISKIHKAVTSGDNLVVQQLLDVEMKTMLLSIIEIWGECSNLEDLKGLIKSFDVEIWEDYKSTCNDPELLEKFNKFKAFHGIR